MMMQFNPMFKKKEQIMSKLLFTNDHEWLKIDDDTAYVGITEYAQSQLGDIIFVELPEIGDTFNQGDSIGTIEAVKTVADIYTPLKGVIIQINTNIEDSPELINSDPFSKGWLVKIKLNDDLSISYGQWNTDDTGTVDEEVSGVSVGYSMGGMRLKLIKIQVMV